MGRGKTVIGRIENPTARQVTFNKRRQGLFKKTHELSVLCDVEIACIVFSSTGNLFDYSTPSSSVEEMSRRYLAAKGLQIPEQYNPHSAEMHDELRRMKQATDDLELSVQRYTGQDLTSLCQEDLIKLEKQLEWSVNKVRARKGEVLLKQKDTLQRKGKMLEYENEQIHNLMEGHHQAAILMEQQQQAARTAMLNREQEDQQMFDQFIPFLKETEAETSNRSSSTVLQLAPFSSMFQPNYRVRPTQPNLQDFNLRHHPNYGYEGN